MVGIVTRREAQKEESRSQQRGETVRGDPSSFWQSVRVSSISKLQTWHPQTEDGRYYTYLASEVNRAISKTIPTNFLSCSRNLCAAVVSFMSASFWVFYAPYYTGFTEWRPLLYPGSAYFTAIAEMRGVLSEMAHVGKWRPARISRIPAESDKALKCGKTT